jgi:hypothetical protein
MTEITPTAPETGGEPQAAVTAVTAETCQPPPTCLGALPGFINDAIEDVRRHQSELVRNEASEFSIGKGMEPPWVARQARREHRYATPDEGGRYHGLTPPCGPPRTPMRHYHRGGVQLGKALRRYG